MDAEHYRGLSDGLDPGPRRRRRSASRSSPGPARSAFTVGADIKSFVAKPPASAEIWLTQKDQLLNRGLEVWKPVIAAVNGLCLGGGMTLLFATDIRVRAEHATFSLAEVKRGIIAGNGGTQRVLRQLPHAIGMEMLLTGDSIDAAAAARWGLVNKVVPASELMTPRMRLCAAHRAECAARRAGGQGAGDPQPRSGPRLGAAARAARQPDAAVQRGRRGRTRGLCGEAAGPLQGEVSAVPHAIPGPLNGIVVLDLGQIYNGPYCTFLMARAGATVIKVEPPGGENMRRRGVVGGAMLPFAMLNSNKNFVTLEPEERRRASSSSSRGGQAGRCRGRELRARRHGPARHRAERLHGENPRLIYAAGSGYGWSGPYRDYPAMDLTVQAMSAS